MKRRVMALLLSSALVITAAGCSATETQDGEENLMEEQTENSQYEEAVEEQTENLQDGEAAEEQAENSQSEETITGNYYIEKYLSDGYSALFADPYMQNGINVNNANGDLSGKIVGYNANADASWTYGQWYSKYDITDYYKRVYSNGGYTYDYISKGKSIDGEYVSAKRLTVDSKAGTIYMELNAETEYDAPRKSGEGWPHTLLSQDFSSNLIHVSELEGLVMNMDYTVTKFEDKMGSSADSSLHCAQLVWYVTLQNRTAGHPDYGSYIWFGINLWDNRTEGGRDSGYAAQDAGKDDATGAFIYNPSSDYIFGDGIQPVVNERKTVNFDILGAAKTAFETAKQSGYLGDTAWEDLYIGGMNFGFEVTGTYNVGVQIDSVGIYYK